MKLSVVIPAYNEEESIPHTIETLISILNSEDILHEVLVVNDNSKDNTLKVLEELSKQYPTLKHITNLPPKNGFGYAVRAGLESFSGDCVAIFMADMSDSPDDLVRFYNRMAEKDLDCIFGSRFSKGGKVYDYPKFKLFLNRIFNTWVNIF